MAITKPDLQAMEQAAKTIKRIKDERRVKLVIIREDVLIGWFASGMDRPASGFLTFVEGIPENTVVLGVDYAAEYGGFRFTLGNLEFEKVPEGQYPKALNIVIRQTRD